MAILAVLRLFVTVHATLHALLYMFYRESRDLWDSVTRWLRPYFWIIEDQFWILITLGQLVL